MEKEMEEMDLYIDRKRERRRERERERERVCVTRFFQKYILHGSLENDEIFPRFLQIFQKTSSHFYKMFVTYWLIFVNFSIKI